MKKFKPHSSSDSYRRTRRDHAAETAEDYVEAIADIQANQVHCRLVDLARRFGVSHVTALRIIARLADAGWVTTRPYRPIELTAKGRRLAARSRERHEIVFQLLLALGVHQKQAAVDAEGMEHHVSPATLNRFRAFLAESLSKPPRMAK